MQNKIIKSGNLLNESGELIQKGYATSLILDYSRKMVKSKKLRLKEWDYYLITNDDFAIAMTIADNSYMGLVSASIIDFKKPSQSTKSIMTFMPKGKIGLPSSSKIGDVRFENSKIKIAFYNDGKKRHLSLKLKEYENKKNLLAEIDLFNEPQHSMVIATPFKENKRAFYYNQKIIGMKATGYAKLGDEVYDFSQKQSYGLLDWGRGIWTYKNVWFWGAAQGQVDGVDFGFNIGYGFGDTSSATENMLFYDGKANKLDKVKFCIPEDKCGQEKYMQKWRFTSNDGRFEMEFEPIVDRNAFSSALIISSEQHQVFGKFTGKAVLDDGKIVEIKDFLGFAEKVKNKW